MVDLRYPSVTWWNRVEPSPRADGFQRGLEAAVRDPLWFLTRQWQLGEFAGEDAASPAFASIAAGSTRLDGWRPGGGAMRPYDGSAPLEALVQNEATTPDLRTAVELGQALERRLAAEGAAPEVTGAFRAAYPLPRAGDLSADQRRDRALVRLVRVCGGRGTHGVDALRAAEAAGGGVPPELDLPAGAGPLVESVLAWFTGWVRATLGPVGLADAGAWRPDRLEYGLEVTAATPARDRVVLRGHTGPFGELDWYAFDETSRTPPKAEGGRTPPVTAPPSARAPGTGPPGVPEGGGAPSLPSHSVIPAAVRFPGMPDPRWWSFEDARYDWASVDTDRRDLGRALVMDFMLVQGNDWFVIPFGQAVGTLATVGQLLVRDVFGDDTLVRRADAERAAGERRWTMFSTAAPGRPGGLADYFLLPPGALRTTLDGPDLEEVRFVRDEQANLVWAVEATTEDGTGRPWPGRERALGVPASAPPPATGAPLRYLLATPVPVNWIPFVPVQTDAARRSVALERAAMQRLVDGALQAVLPAGRILNPSGLADLGVYRVQEEEVPRSGTRVLRADRRTRWTGGSTHLWTSRRRRAGEGEASSGLRYDLAGPWPGDRG
jgi:hypothetical protein